MTLLLELPSELRAQIWSYAFANQNVTPQVPDTIHYAHCKACQSMEDRPTEWRKAYLPLLTCSQIYREAKDKLYSSMDLFLSNLLMIWQGLNSKSPLLSNAQRMTLYLHLDEANRVGWSLALTSLLQAGRNVEHLTIHNHMRPPMNYENLVDGIFFAAPLVANPSPASRTLHFDYIFEDVMFASPFLGEIKCSDALEEHELVIRDLLVDDEFATAATQKDEEAMTGALLRIARSHEQPWFAKLQRRRLAELARQGETMQSGNI